MLTCFSLLPVAVGVTHGVRVAVVVVVLASLGRSRRKVSPPASIREASALVVSAA